MVYFEYDKTFLKSMVSDFFDFMLSVFPKFDTLEFWTYTSCETLGSNF